ncbi:MAG: sigma-54 dependent transcriptional regulator [Candidatus Cloacimonetes bacterium]|nr:sigma-54 dependent transcriptional regulator [Candidatus Cloacimonadota bacterium]MCF7814166.1 sigma-54 dependent transcriptional regulator [Candidatus Cloacimonadota bacterium]MCF7868771.1 sigma-54 dependent transcriptional regulator [Candidatus Cloacimonadota bacterium]MCF7884174.1 sigma-54 dependent transcriptional regulator [Candidatus Cloacimonadota bacterium]
MNKILVIDDNKNMQIILKNILSDEGYDIDTVGNGKDGLSLVKELIPDLVLLDIRLPQMNGMDVLKKIKEYDSEMLVIMITAFGDIKTAVEAMKMGAYDYVTKPFVNEDLTLTIQKALKTRSLSREVKCLRKKLDGKVKQADITGESPQINRVKKQINLIAPTDMSVIIQGKSGTGKEVVANLIHKKSNRKNGAFVPIDCGAIPDTLVESELFGYEKGAFTGAHANKKGKFEAASGGTLFLDEITNLPAAAQAKLLRVLQERSIQRVGSTKSIKVDVRIIVATNLDILEVVNSGDFRDDLFHRLNEFKLDLPLLSKRKDDIPLLADEFLEEANDALCKEIAGFTPEAMKVMLSYSWPGNVRELKHLVKRAVLLEDNNRISKETIDQEITMVSQNKSSASIDEYYQRIMDKGYSLADITSEVSHNMEREIIQRVLLDVKYNKSKAARILNIDRNTLYSKIKILDI